MRGLAGPEAHSCPGLEESRNRSQGELSQYDGGRGSGAGLA